MRTNPNTPKSYRRRLSFLALLLLLPLLLAGCPEFGNDVVNAIDQATRSILNSAVDLFYDQFRGPAAD